MVAFLLSLLIANRLNSGAFEAMEFPPQNSLTAVGAEQGIQSGQR